MDADFATSTSMCCHLRGHSKQFRAVDIDIDVLPRETELNVYTRVQQVSLDTNSLMWWKQHVSEFPRLTRMVRQYLIVTDTSVSPERLFFRSVGLVKSEFRVRLLDTTLIDVILPNKHPELNLNESKRNDTHSHTHTKIHTHLIVIVHLHDLIPCPSLPTINYY
jgi:hypothetical protein